MGRAFTAIGVSMLIGAVVWWEAFYSEVQRYLGTVVPCAMNVCTAFLPVVVWWPTSPSYLGPVPITQRSFGRAARLC